jgi:hypothetical protein
LVVNVSSRRREEIETADGRRRADAATVGNVLLKAGDGFSLA